MTPLDIGILAVGTAVILATLGLIIVLLGTCFMKLMLEGEEG